MKYHILIFVYLLLISCQKKNSQTENKQVDTIQKLQTSDINVTESNRRNFFRDCKASEKNDVLTIMLSDISHSEYFRELKIIKKDKKFTSEFYETASVTDSSYKPPVFKTIKQNFSFIKKGDSLKGKIEVEILATYRWEKHFSDTIKINGTIKTIVE